MNTLKTFDKQSATFIAALIQNIPSLSGAEMQYLIEHPKEIAIRTAALSPTLRQVLSRQEECAVELHEIDKHSDFLIMQSKIHPDLGIAVLNRRSCQKKEMELAFYSDTSHSCSSIEWFEVASARHDEWYKGIVESPNGFPSQKRGVRLIRDCCAMLGIKYLVFLNWNWIMDNGVDGLILIDPSYADQMNILDKTRFLEAFYEICSDFRGPASYNVQPISMLFTS